jgi:tripartite-type tricarboxylate transporter receptor subunit TctC
MFMLVRVFLAFVGLSLVSNHTWAQPYYQGKTIQMIVGYSAGGGFDAYARTIARHMGKHVPGNPSFVVENRTGAGSLIAANHLYKVSKPDGLSIGHFIGGFFLGQVLDQPGIEFDSRQFQYLGSPVVDHSVCVFTKASGITSIDTWRAAKTPVKVGGLAPGSSTPDNVTRILKEALGLPLQLVTGYKGVADIRLAAEAGELAGGCWGWDGTKRPWAKQLESRDVAVVLQNWTSAHVDLPNVPLAIDQAKTDEAWQLIRVGIHDQSAILRPFVLPPKTPKDKVAILKKAFMDTLNDPEFKADAAKGRLDIEPVAGEEVEKIVHGLFKLAPALISRFKDILYK